MKQSERNMIRAGLECRALKQGPEESTKAHMQHKPYQLDWKKLTSSSSGGKDHANNNRDIKKVM